MSSKTAMEEYTVKMLEIDPEWDPIESKEPGWVRLAILQFLLADDNILNNSFFFF